MSTEDGDKRAADDFVEPKFDEDALDSFTLRDELDEAFGQPTVQRTGGKWTANEQELPRPVEDTALEDALVPPFTLQNQVCVADRSAYVLRDEWGEELIRVEPDQVEVTANGRARISVERFVTLVAAEAEPASASPEKRVWNWVEHRGVRDCYRPGGWVELEPVRPQCRHYVLQLDPPRPSEAHVVKQGWMHRYCAARRNTVGAFMGLDDTALKACSLREPYDVESGRLLRKFDDDLLHKSENREWYPMFDLTTKELIEAQGQDTNG